MPASGELAALFAKRGIGDDDETDSNNEEAACNEAKGEITIPSTTAGLPPRSSTTDISSSTMQPPTAAAEEVDTPSQPINEEGPIKITNLIHNAEVKAVFDERNLEAGIPTPSFLADMRKNLKKPGEKRSSTTPTPQSKVGGGGYSSDSDAMKKKKDTSDDNVDKKGKSGNTNYNSDSEIKTALSSSSNLLSKSLKKQPTASTSASTCSSDNEVPMDEEKITATAKHGTLAARRSRMVASRTAMSSSASSTTSDPNSKPPPKKSPSQARKERLLARIRASNASTSGNKSVESNEVFDASKTSIISPKSDEFEVCFADDNMPPTHNPYLTSDTKNESIDSIGNELNESYGSAATLPTNNIQSKVKISMTKSNRSCTPEKSRLQNAATPKIRGNSNFARYEDKEEKVNEGTTTTGLITSQSSSQPQTSPIKQNPSPTKLSSFQEQQQQQQLETDYVASTPRRAINELYPMRQSPSQLSQMSGLTTPSCFPQELTAPLGGHSHLQQPMLIGGPIHEAASFKSDQLDNVVGVGGGSSAFSPGVEAENRRLREQVGTMAQKLEEKDAIISQLMKRIADLEMNNSAARGAAQAQHVNTTFVMDQGRSPSNVSSHVSSSLWDQSQLQGSTTRSQTSGSAFHQPVRKNNSDVRSSVDSTSACLSMPSQSPSIKSTSLQKKSKQRGRSSGGSTPSTASVTTTNSSKSGKRTTTRSRSKSSRTGGSQKSKKKDDDERKFVC